MGYLICAQMLTCINLDLIPLKPSNPLPSISLYSLSLSLSLTHTHTHTHTHTLWRCGPKRSAPSLQAFVSGLMLLWEPPNSPPRTDRVEPQTQHHHDEQHSASSVGGSGHRGRSSARDAPVGRGGEGGGWKVVIGYGLADADARILKVPLDVMEEWLFGRESPGSSLGD